MRERQAGVSPVPRSRLQVQRRRKRRGVAVERRPLTAPDRPNQVWSIDFVSDSLETGRRLKCLTIVDDFTKEAIDIVVDHGISGQYVTRVLEAGGAVPGAAEEHPNRSGTGVHWQSDGRLGLSTKDRAAFDRGGQAHAERLRRKLQWEVPRRVSKRALVQNARRGSCSRRCLAHRLQPAPATQRS